MDKIELLSEQYKNCCAENDALKAENARYREALEVIASRQDEWSLEVTLRSDVIFIHPHIFVFELQQRTEIAQRALKGE